MFQQSLPMGKTDERGMLLIDHLDYAELARRTKGIPSICQYLIKKDILDQILILFVKKPR